MPATRKSLPADYIRKHRFAFLIRMLQTSEPLVLLSGGYWTLRSLEPWWNADIDVVTEAEAQEYLTKATVAQEGCRDARTLTETGAAFASKLYKQLTAPAGGDDRTTRRPVRPVYEFIGIELANHKGIWRRKRYILPDELSERLGSAIRGAPPPRRETLDELLEIPDRADNGDTE